MKVIQRDPSCGYLDGALWVPKEAINTDGVKAALTFENFEAKSGGLFLLYQETAHHLLVPREFWDPSAYPFPVIDCRPTSFPKVDIRSRVQLDHRILGGKLVPTGKTVQRDATAALLAARGGVLQLACGLGKTVVALNFAALLRMPTIIVLDTTQLMKQWREEIDEWLDVPGGIGLIQGPIFDWKKSIVLATYHTLGDRADEITEEVRRWFGLAIWDEGHHLPAPTFSRSADLFYGYRLALTATPDRMDGRHVIVGFHVGPVLHKNLSQDLKPTIVFRWTGFALDRTDPEIVRKTCDINGELHIGKTARYLGTVRPRIAFILDLLRGWVAEGRKILVLSKAVDTLINLLAAYNGASELLTDYTYPTPQDVGETLPGIEIDTTTLARIKVMLQQSITLVLSGKTKNVAQETARQQHLRERLQSHEVYKKQEALWNKKRSEYLKELLRRCTEGDAGLMIAKVGAETRTRMLRKNKITFSIMKYGREGLNEKSLDTVLLLEPISDKGALQQMLGRTQRDFEGKLDPLAYILEDDIGQYIGMCNKLRGHLRDWPSDEGGPMPYENVGKPKSVKGQEREWNYSTRMGLR